MIDIGLTENGDLVFVKNESKKDPFKISFDVTNGKSFRIQFKPEEFPALTASENAIKISFDIGQSQNNKRAVLLSENDSMIQAIKIRIQTSYGDLAERTTIGSKLETVRHLPLYASDTASKTVSIVKACIEDILPDAEVKAVPEVVRTSEGYIQRMALYIYNDNILIFKF